MRTLHELFSGPSPIDVKYSYTQGNANYTYDEYADGYYRSQSSRRTQTGGVDGWYTTVNLASITADNWTSYSGHHSAYYNDGVAYSVRNEATYTCTDGYTVSWTTTLSYTTTQRATGSTGTYLTVISTEYGDSGTIPAQRGVASTGIQTLTITAYPDWEDWAAWEPYQYPNDLALGVDYITNRVTTEVASASTAASHTLIGTTPSTTTDTVNYSKTTTTTTRTNIFTCFATTDYWYGDQHTKVVGIAAEGSILYVPTTTGLGIDIWSKDSQTFTRVTDTYHKAIIQHGVGTTYQGFTTTERDWQCDTKNGTVRTHLTTGITMQSFEGFVPPTKTYSYVTLVDTTQTANYSTGSRTKTVIIYGFSTEITYSTFMSFDEITYTFDGHDTDLNVKRYSASTNKGVKFIDTIRAAVVLEQGRSQTYYVNYPCGHYYTEYDTVIYASQAAWLVPFGFQDLSACGPLQPYGRSITSDVTFYIGSDNTAYAEDQPLATVLYNKNSTAVNAGISYSYSQGDSGRWSVSTADSSTSGTFSANVGLDGIGDRYKLSYLSGYNFVYYNGSHYNTQEGPVTMGGELANTKLNRYITFHGYGFRYTMRDSAGSTSYMTNPTNGTFSLNLGTSILGLEPIGFATRIPYMDGGAGGFGGVFVEKDYTNR